MSKTQHPGSKNRFSRGLFAVALLLGIFTCSGFIAQNQPKFDRQQTTLVVSAGTKLSKNIAYNWLIVKTLTEKRSALHFADLIRLHNHRIKVRFAELNRLYIPLQTGLFYRIKTPAHQAGDNPVVLLG